MGRGVEPRTRGMVTVGGSGAVSGQGATGQLKRCWRLTEGQAEDRGLARLGATWQGTF